MLIEELKKNFNNKEYRFERAKENIKNLLLKASLNKKRYVSLYYIDYKEIFPELEKWLEEEGLKILIFKVKGLCKEDGDLFWTFEITGWDK